MNVITRPSPAATDEVVLGNARVVLADEIVSGHVVMRNAQISEIGTGAVPASAIDLGGDYLLPGLVDIHTDHFEKHIYPRAHVRWDPIRAALAHDAQIIGAGITTVFDSITVGSLYKNLERKDVLAPMIEALEEAAAAGILKAEHFVHLRCEVTGTDTPELAEAHVGRDIVRMASIMEHFPGHRQSRDIEAYLDRRMAEADITRDQAITEMKASQADHHTVIEKIRPMTIALLKDFGLPLLSHDDTEVDQVVQAAEEGILMSEFPCTIEAARMAREKGLLIVGGAPNVMRGGSQSGNVAVKDMIAEGLVDILASDYVPRSMLDAAFLIGLGEGFAPDLPEAVRTVSKIPAEASGLQDRGEIALGKRADLLHVTLVGGCPVLRQVWREGVRVA